MGQTYTNIEIIVINDCSPDNISQILEKYELTDSRINVYNLPENCGLGKARDFGIKRASGKYIMFVDSDDWIAPNTIEECVRFIEMYNADFVEFQYKRVSEFIEEENCTVSSYFVVEGAEKIEAQSDHIACNKLFITETIKASGLQFKYRVFEDTHFTRDYALRSKRAVFINHELYRYYFNPNSLTSTISKEVLEDSTPTDEVIKVYCNHGYQKKAQAFMLSSRNYLLRRLVVLSHLQNNNFAHHPSNSPFVNFMKPWIQLYNKSGILFRIKAYGTLGWKYTLKSISKHGF